MRPSKKSASARLRRSPVIPIPSTSFCSTEISTTRPIFRVYSNACVHTSVAPRGRRAYNWYFAWLFRLAEPLGLAGPPITTYVTQADLDEPAALAMGVRAAARCACPVACIRARVAVQSRISAHRACCQTAAVRMSGRSASAAALAEEYHPRRKRVGTSRMHSRMPDFGAPVEVIFGVDSL